MTRKLVWLVWQINIERIDTSLVQFQELRVIASSEDKAKIYKTIFEREVKEMNLKKSEFVIEGVEIDHMCGWQDLSKYISRKRFEKDDEA